MIICFEPSISDSEMRNPEGKFQPNLVNTTVFLVSQMMTVATFAVNYRVLLSRSYPVWDYQLLFFIFLCLGCSASNNSFGIEYYILSCLKFMQGRPFMESLRENVPLYRCLAVSAAVVLVCVLNIMPDFNAWLELVPFPSDEVEFLY